MFLFLIHCPSFLRFGDSTEVRTRQTFCPSPVTQNHPHSLYDLSLSSLLPLCPHFSHFLRRPGSGPLGYLLKFIFSLLD